MTNQPSTAAATANGTLTQNTQRQSSKLSSTPPTIGPMLTPTACAAAMMPDRAPLPVRTRRADQDHDGVGAEHRAGETEQRAQHDQLRQIGGEAAQQRKRPEQSEAEQIQQLAAGDLDQPGEYRQPGGEAELVGDGHPAHDAEPGKEIMLEGRQDQLHDARIELADKGADANRADDDPGVGVAAGEERGRRRLPPVQKSRTRRRRRRRAGRLILHALRRVPLRGIGLRRAYHNVGCGSLPGDYR